jgi:hypothetical protein
MKSEKIDKRVFIVDTEKIADFVPIIENKLKREIVKEGFIGDIACYRIGEKKYDLEGNLIK